MKTKKKKTFFRQDQVSRVCETIGLDNQIEEQYRADAIDAPMIVARALEHVVNTVTKTVYPTLMARKLIPAMNGIPVGARTVLWHEYDSAGMARVIENYADDITLADIAVSENESKIKPIATGYSYSVEDLEALTLSLQTGRQATLDVTKAQLADEYIERKFDDLLLNGDANHDIPGFGTNANVTTLSAAAAAGGANAPEWNGADKTNQEIFDDMVNFVTTFSNVSEGIHEMAIIALPTISFNVLARTQFLTGTANPMTILEAFLRQENAAGNSVRVVKWPHLSTVGPGGTPLVIGFEPSEANMGAVITKEATPEPPQAKNFAFIVPVRGKCGGTIIRRPLSVMYMDDTQ